MKIAVFYHSLFFLGNPPELSPRCLSIVQNQMEIMNNSGLTDAAQEIQCGINGGAESEPYAEMLLPPKARKVYHGLQSKSENLTCLMMQDWVRTNPGWAVLYFHTKSATHDGSNPLVEDWRQRMMWYCVHNWQQCVHDLKNYEAVGCHYLRNMGSDGSQNYFAGTVFWVRSEFFATIPSILTRARIKMSGIDTLESRYEAEVIIGNGPRLPIVKDYFPGNPYLVQR